MDDLDICFLPIRMRIVAYRDRATLVRQQARACGSGNLMAVAIAWENLANSLEYLERRECEPQAAKTDDYQPTERLKA